SMEPGQPGGSLIRVPSGFKGSLSADADEFRSVLVEGAVTYQSKESKGDIELQPGSYFGSSGDFDHSISTAEPSIIYVRTDGRYRVHSQY
ncbi:MAG: DUF4437 domain-containing protein, partial [Pseudomonadota bacterium]|nr:DUF4437 domain-containing protein [Pseudomonadota bacterium]